MKLWITLCLICFLSPANADLIEVSSDETPPSTTGGVRPEELPKEEKKESTPAEIATFLDRRITGPSSSTRNEVSATPGVGRLSLDPRYLETPILYSVAETPWWERWWLSLREWVFGEAI